VNEDRTGFLGRWSRRKTEARLREAEETRPTTDPAADAANSPPMPTADAVSATAAAQAPAPADDTGAPPLPTLDDVAALTRDSDYSLFVQRKVAPEVRNAAMKKLFSDPHFNIMDGLDIYIDDYSNPEVMPRSMLRELASSRVLNLLTDEEAAAVAKAESQAQAMQASPVSDMGNASAADDVSDMVDSLSPHESTRVDGPASADEALPSPDSIAPASKPYPSGQA
jgi:hypothetical protein